MSAAETKRAEQVERHFGDCNRLMTRNIDAFHRLRRNEVEGWGIIRQERERKREEARRKRAMGPDPRLVMDVRGTVRKVEGYRWKLQEGLARYKANVGRQPCEFDERWSESPWNGQRDREDHDSGSTQAEAQCALGGQQGGLPEEGGPVPLSIGMRADYQGESAGVGSMDCVPVQFTGKGDAANLQNGTVCQLAVVSGQLSGEGDGDREPSETGRVNEDGGDGPRASSGEKCFVEPRRVNELLSKRRDGGGDVKWRSRSVRGGAGRCRGKPMRRLKRCSILLRAHCNRQAEGGTSGGGASRSLAGRFGRFQTHRPP